MLNICHNQLANISKRMNCPKVLQLLRSAGFTEEVPPGTFPPDHPLVKWVGENWTLRNFVAPEKEKLGLAVQLLVTEHAGGAAPTPELAQEVLYNVKRDGCRLSCLDCCSSADLQDKLATIDQQNSRLREKLHLTQTISANLKAKEAELEQLGTAYMERIQHKLAEVQDHNNNLTKLNQQLNAELEKAKSSLQTVADLLKNHSNQWLILNAGNSPYAKLESRSDSLLITINNRLSSYATTAKQQARTSQTEWYELYQLETSSNSAPAKRDADEYSKLCKEMKRLLSAFALSELRLVVLRAEVQRLEAELNQLVGLAAPNSQSANATWMETANFKTDVQEIKRLQAERASLLSTLPELCWSVVRHHGMQIVEGDYDNKLRRHDQYMAQKWWFVDKLVGCVVRQTVLRTLRHFESERLKSLLDFIKQSGRLFQQLQEREVQREALYKELAAAGGELPGLLSDHQELLTLMSALTEAGRSQLEAAGLASGQMSQGGSQPQPGTSCPAQPCALDDSADDELDEGWRSLDEAVATLGGLAGVMDQLDRSTQQLHVQLTQQVCEGVPAQMSSAESSCNDLHALLFNSPDAMEPALFDHQVEQQLNRNTVDFAAVHQQVAKITEKINAFDNLQAATNCNAKLQRFVLNSFYSQPHVLEEQAAQLQASIESLKRYASRQ